MMVVYARFLFNVFVGLDIMFTKPIRLTGTQWYWGIMSVVILGLMVSYGNNPEVRHSDNHDLGFQRWHACSQVKAKVSESLKDASSAEFDPDLYNRFVPSTDGHYFIHSWVRAKNGWGNLLKVDFIAEVDRDGDVIDCTLLE